MDLHFQHGNFAVLAYFSWRTAQWTDAPLNKWLRKTSLTQPVPPVLRRRPEPTLTPPVPPRRSCRPEAERVSQIAEQNGDKQFLMVDKAHGEIILFGTPRRYSAARH